MSGVAGVFGAGERRGAGRQRPLVRQRTADDVDGAELDRLDDDREAEDEGEARGEARPINGQDSRRRPRGRRALDGQDRDQDAAATRTSRGSPPIRATIVMEEAKPARSRSPMTSRRATDTTIAEDRDDHDRPERDPEPDAVDRHELEEQRQPDDDRVEGDVDPAPAAAAGTAGQSAARRDAGAPRRRLRCRRPSCQPLHPEQDARGAGQRPLLGDPEAAPERGPEAGVVVVAEDVLAGREEPADHRVVPADPLHDQPGASAANRSAIRGSGTFRPIARWWIRARASTTSASARSSIERRSRSAQPTAGLGSARSARSGRTGRSAPAAASDR